MNIAVRVLSVLTAVAMLAGVVYLGILSGTDPRFVVWFGIASAIAAPIALSLLGLAFQRSDAQVIEKLSKVPEIERLINEAKTQEEKIRLLEEERARLADVIKTEARRQAIEERVAALENDAVRILREFDSLRDEADALNATVTQGSASEEIQRLRERVKARQRGDIVIRLGTRFYRIDRDLVLSLPLNIGGFLFPYLRLVEKISNKPRDRGAV